MNSINNSLLSINMIVIPDNSVQPSFSVEPPKLWNTSNYSTSNIDSSFLPSTSSTEFDFQSCLMEDTTRLLCENIATEVPFNCSFPKNSDAMNDTDTFSYVEISQLSATGVAFAVALVGNLLVVIAASFDVTLRSPVNMFLVNLSLADILVSVVCLWDNALRSLSYNYLLGPIGCKAGGFIHMACLFVSVLTLAGIALDRVYAVLLPFHARHTPPRPKWVIGIIWALSTAAALPFSALREYRIYKWQDFTEIQCTYSRGRGYYDPEKIPPCENGPNYVNTYHLSVTILLFFIPVIVILLAYFLIIWKLWKTQAFVEHSRVISKVHINAKKKVVRLALVVLTAFLVCWTPLQALILMSVFGNDQYAALSEERHLFWIYFIAYSNSALNPIIYGGFSKSYRATLLRLLRRGRRRTTPSLMAGRSRGTITLTFPQKSEGPLNRQRQSLSSIISAPFASLNNSKKRHSPPFLQNDPNCKEAIAMINDPRVVVVGDNSEMVQFKFEPHVCEKDLNAKRSCRKSSKENSVMINNLSAKMNGSSFLSETKNHTNNKDFCYPPFRDSSLSIQETDFINQKEKIGGGQEDGGGHMTQNRYSSSNGNSRNVIKLSSLEESNSSELYHKD